MAAFDSAKPRSAAQRAFLLGVGSRVATLRGQGGWSQEELAERAGINVQTLSRLERGVGAVRLDTFAVVAGALDTTPADMLGGLELPVSKRTPKLPLQDDPRARDLALSWERLSPTGKRLLVEMATELGAQSERD